MFTASNRSKRLRGLTLIETLASETILVVGICAVMGGMGSLSRTESRSREVQTMTSLAQRKYEELVAITADLTTGQNGDFRDQNINDYQWSSDVQQTGVTNLVALTVTVTSTTDQSNKAPQASVSGLLYQPPANSSTTSSTGGG